MFKYTNNHPEMHHFLAVWRYPGQRRAREDGVSEWGVLPTSASCPLSPRLVLTWPPSCRPGDRGNLAAVPGLASSGPRHTVIVTRNTIPVTTTGSKSAAQARRTFLIMFNIRIIAEIITKLVQAQQSAILFWCTALSADRFTIWGTR